MSSNNLENLLKEMADAITKLEVNKPKEGWVIIPDEEIRQGISEGRLKVFNGDVKKINFDSIKIYNKIEDVPKNER